MGAVEKQWTYHLRFAPGQNPDPTIDRVLKVMELMGIDVIALGTEKVDSLSGEVLLILTIDGMLPDSWGEFEETIYTDLITHP